MNNSKIAQDLLKQIYNQCFALQNQDTVKGQLYAILTNVCELADASLITYKPRRGLNFKQTCNEQLEWANSIESSLKDLLKINDTIMLHTFLAVMKPLQSDLKRSIKKQNKKKTV